MMEDTWQICYSADVCCPSATAWCCRFIAYFSAYEGACVRTCVCVRAHVSVCVCARVRVCVVIECRLIWCFQGDLNVYCCWGFCLSSLLFFHCPSSCHHLSSHHFFVLITFLLLTYLDLCFSTPLLLLKLFHLAGLSFVLYPSKHHSHTSFLSPCVVSIYLVFLSLFIAASVINCMGDLSLTQESFLNCALIKCVLRIETTETKTYQCR